MSIAQGFLHLPLTWVEEAHVEPHARECPTLGHTQQQPQGIELRDTTKAGKSSGHNAPADNDYA